MSAGALIARSKAGKPLAAATNYLNTGSLLMEIRRFLRKTLGFGLVAVCSAVAPFGQAEEGWQGEGHGKEERHAGVVRIDHAVPHVSTLGANADETVNLFVRELVREGGDRHRPRKAVLMVHGASVPALAMFDLGSDDYSWGLQLAKAGLDVFIVDLQGSGRSPLPDRSLAPMTDPCNVTAAQQQLYAVDRPKLPSPCNASFAFRIVNSKSEWDEVDTVVNYIIAKRGVDKVALLGNSRGSLVVGPYAVQHPEKVESVFLQSPIFNPAASPGIGLDRLAPPVKPAGQLPDLSTRFTPCTPAEITTTPPTCPGISPNATPPYRILPPLNATFPAAMALGTRQDLIDRRWQREIKCNGQVEDGIADRIWNTIMENDQLGSTWGPPEGLMRNRSFFPWGFTPAVASGIKVPTLIVFGELDTEGTDQGFPVAVNSFLLYDTIAASPGVAKLLFKVACTGHFMPWEGRRKVLHHLSRQWLKHGSIDGNTSGKFLIDTAGNMTSID